MAADAPVLERSQMVCGSPCSRRVSGGLPEPPLPRLLQASLLDPEPEASCHWIDTQVNKNTFNRQASYELPASHSNLKSVKRELCTLGNFGVLWHPHQHTYLYKPTKYSGRTVPAPADLMRRGSGKGTLLLVSSSTSSPMGLTTVHISNRSLPISWVTRKSYRKGRRWRWGTRKKINLILLRTKVFLH